mgnify:CR=1 FL=1
MPPSGFTPLLDVLDDWFAHALDDIPEPLRSRAEHEFYPYAWDALAPSQRRDLAIQLDYFADPANEAERDRSWKLECQISEAETRLGELKDTKPSSVSEIATKRELLAVLGDELDRLVQQRRRPDSGRGSARSSMTRDATPETNFGVHKGQKMTNFSNEQSGRDGSPRTRYERWLDESRYDGWFTRLNHQAFGDDLIEFVCCYPDGSKDSVARNRDRIEYVINEVFASQDVACDEADVPQHVIEQFRLKFAGALKALKKPLPKDEGALNLKVWNSGFPGDWRSEPTANGDQAFFAVMGYQCWMSAQGKLRWEQPRFVPGRDYDGTFRGSELVTKCRLEVVRAIAEFRHGETGLMLNSSLAAALDSRHDGMSPMARNPATNPAANQVQRSDANLLAILAASRKLSRADQAKQLGVTDRGLRDILARARKVQGDAIDANKWLVVPRE